MKTIVEKSEIYETFKIYDEVNNSIFKVIDARLGNGDIYFVLSKDKFFVNNQSSIYPAFKNLHNQIKEINKIIYNQYPAHLKEQLGGDVIMSDDAPDISATKMVFSENSNGITITTKNFSSDHETHNQIRMCYSGSQTSGLFITAFHFLQDLQKHEQQKTL